MADTLLKVGDTVPTLTVQNQAGEDVSLSDYQGKKLIIFFYPKASSPSCTKEACSLRDGYDSLRELGYEILGVSPDNPKPLQNFINKQRLNYPLLSDPNHELTQAFGAWGEKSMRGKTYMGLLRTTFLVDEDGAITHVIPKVTTKDHANQILEVLGTPA